MPAADDVDPGPAAEPEAPPPLPPEPDRKVLLAELTVVLCFAVLPHLMHALIYYFGRATSRPSFGIEMLTLTVISLQTSAPLLDILWRSGQPLTAFGFHRPRWFLDAGAGLAILLALRTVNIVGWEVGYSLFGDAILGTPTQDGPFNLSRTGGDVLVLFIAMTANAFAEELAMRSYLMTRLRQLGVSPGVTVLISAGLFGAYHIYQGLWAAVIVTLFGLVFAFAFLRLGRIWPVVLGHLLLDLQAYLQSTS